MSAAKRRCVYCKEYFPAANMFKTPSGWLCSAEHAIEYSNKMRDKQRKSARNARKREFLDNDRGKQLKDAQKAFNEFIRLRDKGKPCISCSRIHNGQIHAGHYRSVGAAPQLRFNQFNCHAQCAPCNNHKSGNAIEYRINLVKKIGLEKVEWIESQNTPLRLRLDDIRAIKNYYRTLVKRLNSEEPT